MVVFLVQHLDIQPCGGVCGGQQDGDGSLVIGVQQTAIRQEDGKGVLCAVLALDQRHQRLDYGLFPAVADDYGVLAHNGGAGLIGVGFAQGGDDQLAVLVGLALFLIAQVVSDSDIQRAHRGLCVVQNGDEDAVARVHIHAIGEQDMQLAVLHFHIGPLDGTGAFKVLYLDRQGNGLAVLIRPADGDLSLRVGVAGRGRHSELAVRAGLAGGEVIVLVGHDNADALHGGLILLELDRNGGLGGVVDQPAIRQDNREGTVLMERNCGIVDGVAGLGIRNRHKVIPHNSLAVVVGIGKVIDFADGAGLQHLAAVDTLAVLAALGLGGRLLIHDPVPCGMARGVYKVRLIAVAALAAGIGGIAQLGAGGRGHFLRIAVAGGLCQHSAADGAELGVGAGGLLAGGMALFGHSLQPVIAAAFAAVLHHAVAVADGIGHHPALIPIMAQGVGVIVHIAVLTAGAGIGGIAALGAGRLGHDGLVVVAQRVGVVALIAVAAVRAGVGGKAQLQAGGRGHFWLEVMAAGLVQHSAADGAGAGVQAGRALAGGMAGGGNGLHPGIPAAVAGVLLHTLAGAGGIGDHFTVIPAMAQRLAVVAGKGAAAAVAAVDSLPARCAGGGGGVRHIIVGQGVCDVGDLPLAADLALFHGIAGVDTGGLNGVSRVTMLALGGAGGFHIAAADADFQQLALGLAGGLADKNTLIGMAQRVLIVPFLNDAAVGAEIAGVAQRQAGGGNGVQQLEVVVAVAALIPAAAALAAGVLTAAVGISAAAGTGAVICGHSVPQPHIRHAVLRHLHAVIGVDDLIIDSVLALLGVAGRRGQGAGLRRIAVADLSADAALGQVGNGQGMGLAVYHTIVTGHHALCRHIGGLGVVAEGAVFHNGKAPVADLRQDFRFHGMALQHRAVGMAGAIAEAAVFAACGDLIVVGAVRVLIAHSLVQILHKLGGAVVEIVDILIEAIAADAAVAVHGAAGVTHGFCPMIAGINGIHAGGAVEDAAHPLAAYHRAVRVHHISGQGACAVAGVLRGAPCGKAGGLFTDGTVKGLMGQDGIGVQLVGAVVGGQPMLRGVMVSVLLRGKRHGHDAHGECQRQQQADKGTGNAVCFFIHAIPPVCP